MFSIIGIPDAPLRGGNSNNIKSAPAAHAKKAPSVEGAFLRGIRLNVEMSRKVQSENTQRMDVWMWKDFEAKWSVAK